MEPGTRLTEKFWAEKLGVNRADIRQALSRLTGEGLLQAGIKGGFFVRKYSVHEMLELTAVRLTLEIGAAKLAVKNAADDNIRQLFEIADLMRKLAENNFIAGFCEADLRFHEMLIKAAHNKKLEQLYQSANLPLSNVFLENFNPPQEFLLNDAEKHRQIVVAISEKDFQKTAALLEEGLQKLTNQNTPVPLSK